MLQAQSGRKKKLHVIILIQSDVLAPVHDSGSFLTVSQTQNLSRIETWGSCKGHMLEIFLSEPNPSWNIEVPMFFFFFGRCSSNKTSIKPIKKNDISSYFWRTCHSKGSIIKVAPIGVATFEDIGTS